MIFDFHTHLGTDRASGRPLSTDDARRQADIMAGHGVTKTATSLVDALLSNCYDHRAANDLIAEAVRGLESVFYPFAVINPYDADAADEVRRCHEVHGFLGLKLHPWLQGFSVAGEYMRPVVEACLSTGMVIIFHDGTPPYCTPFQIANLCRWYPEAKIVSGHSGLNDLWQNALTAAKKHENFYLCLSGPSSRALEAICRNAPQHKLLYGSDMVGAKESVLVYRLHKVLQLPIDESLC